MAKILGTILCVSVCACFFIVLSFFTFTLTASSLEREQNFFIFEFRSGFKKTKIQYKFAFGKMAKNRFENKPKPLIIIMYNISKVKKGVFRLSDFITIYYVHSHSFFFAFIHFISLEFIHFPLATVRFICLFIFFLFILLENFPTFDMYYNILCQHLSRFSSFSLFFSFLCIRLRFFFGSSFFQSFHDLYDRIFLLLLQIILHYIETRNLHAHKIKRFKPLIIPSYDTK